MNLYRILTAKMAKTTATADRPSEDYIACTVELDNTERRLQLEKLYGKAIALTSGGVPLNYPVLSNDATYPLALQLVEAQAAGKELLVLVEGDRVIEKTANPFVVINPTTGKPALDEQGNPRTQDEVMFFCPAAVSKTTILRNISRKLKFVVPEAATTAAPAADVLS